MDERWVCKRCFTSNGGDRGACETCDLARGSEPPAGDTHFPAAYVTEHPTSWWQPLLRFAWIPVVLIVIAVGFFLSARRDDSGQLVSAGDLEVADLQVGDCFDLKSADDTEIASVTAKPCSEAHTYEMIFIGDMTDGAFPSDAQMAAYVEAECFPEFQEFIGVAWEQSRLDVFYFIPTPSGWDAGDREVQCAVYDPADATLTESLRGAGR